MVSQVYSTLILAATHVENNPDVMTTLVHNLGLSRDLSWHDVFSLNDPDLLAFVPRPSHALLLVFPTSAVYKKFTTEADASISEYTASGPQEEVLWFKQTIGNACGLYGLLHAVCNGVTREFISQSQSQLPRRCCRPAQGLLCNAFWTRSDR